MDSLKLSPGDTVDNWTILEFAGRHSHGHIKYDCQCACGYKKQWRQAQLLNGTTNCFQCGYHPPRFVNGALLEMEVRERYKKDVFDTYVGKALITESTPGQKTKLDSDLIIALFRQMSLTGDLIDQVKRHFIYEKDFDYDKISGTTETLQSLVRLETTSPGYFKAKRKHKTIKVSLRTLHAVMGLATEVGELLSTVVKGIVQGGFTDEDQLNIKEEIGDLFWYLALLFDDLGLSLSQILAANIAKLEKRYGGKFSKEKAVNRNIEAEMQALKETIR